MPRDLRGVIRLRKWEVDEKRRRMAEFLRQEAAILERRRLLEEEIARENAFAAGHVRESGATFGNYAARVRQRRLQLDAALDKVRGLIEEVRNELGDVFRELKTYELAQEARDEREHRERERKEQILLDELGLELYRRRFGSGS